MECANIYPASFPNYSQQMSPADFQKMLYSWFEDKGVLAELRSYLRVQMINKLKNSALGRLDEIRKKPCSLSRQALNLVIAEHLLREGHHYTLSIFSTEVPHQLPLSLFESSQEKWRFDKESILNLLELIGVGKFSKDATNIVEAYFDNDLSLLNCIILGFKKEIGVDDNIDYKANDNNDRDAIIYLKRTLSNIGLPKNVISDLENRLEENLEQEKKYGLLLKKECTKFIDELKNQLNDKNGQIKKLIEDQVKLSKENSRLKEDYKRMKRRTNQVIVQEKSISDKRDILDQKIDELNKLQNELKSEYTKKISIKQCDDSCKNNLEQIRHLQEEIVNLKDINKCREMENGNLQIKLNLLMKDLHNSQRRIDFLNSKSNKIEINFTTDDASSDGFTEDILQQVHMTLEQLEKESDELDLKYTKLQIK